jgi:hypothetical protein
MRYPLYLALAASVCLSGAVTSDSAHAATVVSSSHPNAIFHTFESGSVPFTPYTVPGGIPSGAGVTQTGGAVVMRNGYAGSFSVDFKVKPFDAAKLGDLFFDYKLQQDVKINIFFRMNGVYHCAVFTGPKKARPGAVLMGSIAGVKAEGIGEKTPWRRAHVPLRDWLTTLYPKLDSFPVDEVICGNWDNTGYLMAGFGGNSAGATWLMDNFALVGSGPGDAKFEVTGAPQGAKWDLDGGKATPLAGSAIAVQPADGLHWVRIVDAAGKEQAALPFRSAAKPPVIGAANLAKQKLQVGIDAPGGLALKALTLEIGDKKFTRTSPALSWDGTQKLLSLDAARAGLTWRDGEKPSLNLSGVNDWQGRPAEAKELAFEVDYAKQGAPIHQPRLVIEGVERGNITEGSFEYDLEGWSPGQTGGAIVERDDSEARAGRSSVRLTAATNATPFSAQIRRTAFDAERFPILSFWYRVPASARVDFLVMHQGTTYSLGFTDRTSTHRKLATLPSIVADDKWHHTFIDLLAGLKAAKPEATTFQIDWIMVGDTGWLGNARGVQYWVDEFRLAAAVPSPLKAQLALDDVSGIKAIAWSVTETPEASVPTVAASAGNTIEVTGSGLRYIHARVQNGAGQWSDTIHIPVVLK